MEQPVDAVGLLRDLTEADGVPGFEDDVRQVMRRHLQDVADIEYDHLGSLVARRRGGSDRPRIMLAGHLDEVGFLVTHITDDGFIRFQTLGGWWEQVMLAQRVRVRTRKGDVLGVIGSKPPHLLDPEARKKPVEQKEMFIDVGAADREQAESFGIRPGDPIVPDSPFAQMADPKVLVAKAFDNRIGCAMAVETVRRLANAASGHPNTVYAVGTVQEEVGLRGAETAVEVVQPDLGFALEVSIAGDTPGIAAHEALGKMGKGPTLLLYDRSMVPHRRLRDLVADTAERAGIPLQFDFVAAGGTDAGRIHLFGRGVPSVVIGVPTRYIHTHASILHLDDFENAVKLLTAVIARLDAETVAGLRAYD